MKLKENISDYTESEFIDFLSDIFLKTSRIRARALLDPLLEYFEKILNTQMEQILSII